MDLGLNGANVVERLAGLEIDESDLVFRDDEDLTAHLYALEGVEVRHIGMTKERLELHGVVFGEGPQNISLIAGCHADEPIGPMTAQILPRLMRRHFPELLEAFSFYMVPQMNPEGADRNFPWFSDPLDLPRYLDGALREPPGKDIEFGFGSGLMVRAECRAAQAFLKSHGPPYAAHFSLHGMGFAEGAWCLICQEWTERAGPLMDALTDLYRLTPFPMHDVDRGGEKGFTRIREGFCTTPTVDGMRAYFREQNDRDTARKFMNSSMDWVQSLGGDPLCIVSELPLFLVGRRSPSLDEPTGPRLREALQTLRASKTALDETALEPVAEEFQLTPVPLSMQVRLQFAMVVLGCLASIEEAS